MMAPGDGRERPRSAPAQPDKLAEAVHAGLVLMERHVRAELERERESMVRFIELYERARAGRKTDPPG